MTIKWALEPLELLEPWTLKAGVPQRSLCKPLHFIYTFATVCMLICTIYVLCTDLIKVFSLADQSKSCGTAGVFQCNKSLYLRVCTLCVCVCNCLDACLQAHVYLTNYLKCKPVTVCFVCVCMCKHVCIDACWCTAVVITHFSALPFISIVRSLFSDILYCTSQQFPSWYSNSPERGRSW